MNDVTIIIPNYNGETHLEKCLKSVAEHAPDTPVIVVDNGSTDASGTLVAEHFPRVRLIALKRNTGFAHAVNTGIKAADTPYVFLLNNDAFLTQGVIETLRDVVAKRDNIFSAQPKILQADHPDRIDTAGDRYCALGFAYSRGKDRPAKHFNARTLISSACAGAAMYDKESVLRLGGFDDAHFCYLEDVDLGLRAKVHGFRNVYVPEATVYHVGSAVSGSRHNRFKVRLSAANNLYLLFKNLPPAMLLFNLPLLLTGIVIKGIYFAAKGLFSPYLKGLADGLHKITLHRNKRVPFARNRYRQYLYLQFEMWFNLIKFLYEG